VAATRYRGSAELKLTKRLNSLCARRPRSLVVGLIWPALLVALLPVAQHKVFHLKRQVSHVSASNSKANCIDIPFANGVLKESTIAAVTRLTKVAYNCLTVFNNPVSNWSIWENPWMFRVGADNWDSWLHATPGHQVILSMDLIPQSISDVRNPLSWEKSCAAGSFNQYAAILAKNLVSYGAGRIVVRLGTEANGYWQADYVGSTAAEMEAWGKCYQNEVSAMRAVPGAHFLFVWNPNICSAALPLSKWYPGNSYVDIIGVDVYDQDCKTLKTVSQEGWQAYFTDSASRGSADPNFPSLANIVTFAMAKRKALSFPEWGLMAGHDDPAFVEQMAKLFKGHSFSFESYFDAGDNGTAPLGPTIPKATAAYAKAF
jgi:hypothetical protein